MRKKQLFIMLGWGLWGGSCCAIQTYPLIDQQSTKVIISQTEQNRIAVLGDRIQQVFGAEGRFDVQSDEEGGQIFLILRKNGLSSLMSESSPSSKSFTITLITEEGLTQDLKLIPKDIEAQSILFKPASSVTPLEENQLQQGLKLLKAMVKNEEVPGYTKTSFDKKKPACSSRLCPFAFLKVEPVSVYKGEKLTGKIYTLFNEGEQPISLKEIDFTQQEDIALSLSKATIHPKEEAILYVVSRRVL